MTYFPKSTVNPFYAAAQNRPAFSEPAQAVPQPAHARLPLAPVTGSPVPHLTSLYHFDIAGDYGDRGYPGNCGGQLIRDLLLYFKPANVFDPMAGSGTCRDVCRELNIPCTSRDIREGFDATELKSYEPLGDRRFDFVWVHPPYWRQKLYTNQPGDLSRAPTIEAFLNLYTMLIINCSQRLNPKGKLAILMGDYYDRTEGFLPLTYHTKRLAFDTGLRQRDTDIIRFSHGASSSRKTYESSFIPGLHDVCMIFTRK